MDKKPNNRFLRGLCCLIPKRCKPCGSDFICCLCCGSMLAVCTVPCWLPCSYCHEKYCAKCRSEGREDVDATTHQGHSVTPAQKEVVTQEGASAPTLQPSHQEGHHGSIVPAAAPTTVEKKEKIDETDNKKPKNRLFAGLCCLIPKRCREGTDAVEDQVIGGSEANKPKEETRLQRKGLLCCLIP